MPHRNLAVRRFATLTAATAVIVTGWAGTASAHAHLMSSTPKDASTVTGPLTEITLKFNEPINPSIYQVKVTGPDGRDHTEGKPQINGVTLSQSLKADMGTGRYAIAFRIVSHDGHPVSEQLHFTLNAQGRSSTPAPPAASPSATVTAEPEATKTGSGWGVVLGSVAAFVAVVAVLLGLRRRRAR